MAAAAQGEMKAFRAKQAAEQRRLTDVLCEQLRRDMLRLLNEEIHTDINLHVGQTTFKVHKAILQARAPKFYAKCIAQNATEDIVSMPLVVPSEIQGFLKIMAEQAQDVCFDFIEDSSTEITYVDQLGAACRFWEEEALLCPSKAFLLSKTPDKATKVISKSSPSGSKSSKKSRRCTLCDLKLADTYVKPLCQVYTDKVVNHKDDLMRLMKDLKDQISSSPKVQGVPEIPNNQMGLSHPGLGHFDPSFFSGHMGNPSFSVSQETLVPDDESEEGEISSPEEDDELASSSSLSRDKLLENIWIAMSLLAHLGWMGNFNKSSLTPSQTMTYLGFEINSVRQVLTLPHQNLDIKLLTWKVFLVAITSVRRVSDIQAMSYRHAFLQVFTDRIVLKVDPCYLPKVASDFHRSQEIIIPSVAKEDPELMALDVKSLLLQYLNQTKGFRKADSLFIAFSGPRKGLRVSKTTLARWIKNTIKLAYGDVNLPRGITAHSTRSLSTSWAEQAGVSIEQTYDYDHEPPSELGKDLISLFKGSWGSDLIIQTEDKCFHTHRAILCGRSSYFAAMLSGCWAETSQDLIQIQNVKPSDMMVIMHYIYGGVRDLPKSTEVGQILSIADMYGMEGLREVAIYVLKKDYCKFFIKPMVGMQQSVLECLSIAYSVGEEPLYTSCMKWMEKYFVKCWSERSFASLPADLQRSCLSALVQSISCRNAAFLLMESDRLISNLPGVKWTEKVRNLVSELQDECVTFMVNNFSHTIRSESFGNLLQAQGMSSRPYLLELVLNEIEKNISFENGSSLFIALDELLNLAMKNEMVFTCKIQALRDKLWSFLVQSFYAVRHTEGWKLMRPSDQEKIQAAAFDKGDDRRLAKKPTFTSSQQNRPKIVTSKEVHTTERKRYSDSFLLDQRKMKSDSLGASAHTANIARSSTGKGKEDAKGKDVKKMATKVLKDQKPSEKTAVARPRTIVKNKMENHENATTESCASRSDSCSNLKHVSSVRTGTRPKATNGSATQPPKVKILKKTGKDLASPVKSAVPNIKPANCNGEHSSSSPSPGEKNLNGTTDEQQHSASSQQLNKTSINNPESSKETAAGMKLKSTKISNGVSVKRKVNEAECREPNSTTKKMPVDGKDDSGLLKKKGIKVTNIALQRPKSAPASLAKKQGASGDISDLQKSVSSKQMDIKTDTKLLNNSTAEKQASLNKRATKTSLVPANKAQSTITSSKPSLAVCKSSNHKESKNKVSSNAKTPDLNHKSYQKSSPSKVKKCQSTATQGTETPVSLEEEAKQSASCQLVEETSKPCLQNQLFQQDQETSMGNQNSERQESNLEPSQCQENLTTASVLHCRSNLIKALTETTNESETANDDAGSGEVHISISGEKKPDCKNICDSENSKCADSSSESELCSVKEVERIPKEKEGLTIFQFSQHANVQNPSTAESCLLGGSDHYPLALNNGGHYISCSPEVRLSDYQSDRHTTDAVDHENFGFIGQWNKHSGMLHERESPESESGTASTSSDDIKPRSEDYDAGGSQDDDGSNERGISKCSTMRCHDFLGRSSSDTSTPEELKGYDGSLRIDVKMKKDSTELFRVNSTSDDEGPRRKIEPWLQRDVPRHSLNQTSVCSSVQFSQEMEHISSSADETEDERSETESTGIKVPEEVASEPFQGIVNLAFDDNAEVDSKAQQAAGNSFVRTVLLSVDECEELGSDDGDPHPLQKQTSSVVPTDMCGKNTNGSKNSGCSDNHGSRLTEDKMECSRGQQLTDERSITNKDFEEFSACRDLHKSTEAEYKSQARPCHLELYTELPSDTQRFCSTKTGNACKNQIIDYQGRDNHAPTTESSNNALSAGHIDDNDSLAQTCMYDHRPPKSLSPIYEMDPGEAIEQRLKTEARIMDFEIEDQQFVERDWTLLRQLLADHGSDVDVINSVPEDLSLAQYLINQTLVLARENSKSQGKAWGDPSSPFEDSTSLTVTSFSPDECSSPHGEWTILELETHH
ncbi:BTB/POZ domain-containing protein 8 [Gastrophryne carolinensis]